MNSSNCITYAKIFKRYKCLNTIEKSNNYDPERVLESIESDINRKANKNTILESVSKAIRNVSNSNINETGIEIIACPPGKKLSTISLLSGGEKTFTAISLLFAIIKSRPAPFCILDEVEAALDDVNVDAFGKYLIKLKELSQFIVITHKKKTMEYVDLLYGITMQESGVSKLVSVKLEEIK